MSASTPLRATTVRFAPDAMDLVQAAALEAGVSLAQFVREAAVMRALILLLEEEDGQAVRLALARLRDAKRTRDLSRPRD